MADSGFGSPPPAAGPMTVEGSHSAPFPDPSLAPAAGHYLPGNPLPYLAPSATHQPELLLLSWTIATLHTLVTDLQHHPILTDPIPYPSSFTDQQSDRLYLQLRNTLRHLVTISTDLRQGIRILQFLPRLTLLARSLPDGPCRPFPSIRHNKLSLFTNPTTYHQPTAIPPQHSLITHLTPRARSRRPPTTTTTSIQSTPVNTTTHDRIPLSDITISHSHRSSLHHSLWTATSAPSSSPSPTLSGTWPLRSGPDYTGSSR